MNGETPYLRILLQAAFRAGLVAALLYLPSGRYGWLPGWAYAGLYAAWSCLNAYLLGRLQPALLRLRETEPPRASEGWDRVFVLLSPLLLAVTLWVCGKEGPASQFTAVSGAAFGAMAVSLGVFTWALLSNAYAAGAAVILPGQAVAAKGPYAAVRHPIYLASAVISFSTPAALGSVTAFLPAALLALAIAVRAALEDRLLLERLPGYREYAARVPYRLLPGIW